MNALKSLVCALTLGTALVGMTTTAQAAGDAAAGKAFYEKEYAGNKYAQSAGVGAVGCVTCHQANPKQNTKHIKTGKESGPMAVSAGWRDPDTGLARFADAKKAEKWFKRNCNGVLGRECTAQEKADFTAYLSSQ